MSCIIAYCLLIIVIIFIETNQSNKNLLLSEIKAINNNRNIIYGIINNNNNNKMIYHLDDITKHQIFKLNIRIMDNLIINYDLLEENYSIIRPPGFSYLNFVYLLDTRKFERFSKKKYNLIDVDGIIFIVHSLTSFKNENILEMNDLQNAGSLIIYDLLESAFYYVDFFAGNMSKVIVKIPLSKTNVSPNFIKYVNTFSNFNGHVFTVGVAEYIPFSYCK